MSCIVRHRAPAFNVEKIKDSSSKDEERYHILTFMSMLLVLVGRSLAKIFACISMYYIGAMFFGNPLIAKPFLRHF